MQAASTGPTLFFQRLKAASDGDAVMGIGVVVILSVMLLPLPSAFLDILLAVNVSTGLVILLTAIYSVKPLDFIIFPSMLLVTTLFRIALNVAVDALRRERPAADLAAEPLVAGAENPEAALERKERAEQVRRAVLDLPPASRAVLILREYEALTYQEIAEALDIPIGTVMSRLNYARGQVRRALSRYREGL